MAEGSQVELHIGGFTLRPPRVEEADQALALLSDPAVALWNPAPNVTDRDTAVAWCRRGADWTSGKHSTFSIVDRATDRLMGNISLFAIDREQATAQVGYRIAAHARGQGLATTALGAVCAWAFEEHRLFRIELHHAVENTGSCRVAAKAGFTCEGTLRLATVYGDRSRHDDHVHSRLVTDEDSEGVVPAG